MLRYSKLMPAVVPERCPVCRNIPAKGQRICALCAKQLFREKKPSCRKCGRYIFNCKCQNCVTPAYKAVIAPYTYIKGAKNAIVNLKFYGLGDAAYILAEAMAEEVKEQYKDIRFDFVTAVPLYIMSEFKRGYNQSELLAKELAGILGIRFKKKVLTKIKNTANQHELGGEERRRNLLGAFRCKKDLSGMTVLLTDDIITTGATLSECSKELYKAGATAVYAVTAAVV